MKAYQLTILIVFVIGCNNPVDEHITIKKPVTAKKESSITLQPFDDFKTSNLTYVVNRLKPIVGEIKIAAPVSIPQLAYYKPRNRYRADSLIGWLRTRTNKKQVTLGLTSKDISSTKGGHKDWGIMGLAFRPGNACIVSSFRVNNRDELFKVTIHELAHTQGLPHCPIKSCYMRDAEGGNPTAEENGFCKDCKKHLLKKGWIL